MNIILFGPPGAGKGTQSKYLVNKLNNFQISTGDILRDEIKKNSDIGKQITNDMNDGIFISDDIVNELVEKLVNDPQKKEIYCFPACFHCWLDRLLGGSLSVSKHWT